MAVLGATKNALKLTKYVGVVAGSANIRYFKKLKSLPSL